MQALLLYFTAVASVLNGTMKNLVYILMAKLHLILPQIKIYYIYLLETLWKELLLTLNVSDSF